MFMHRNRGRHAQAVSLGILTAGIIATATATATATAAAAAEASDPFMFVAYSNRAGGAKLATGDYANAAQAVLGQAASMSASDPQALDTNRCVAYTMTQQLAKARRACDAAVADAHRADDTMLSFTRQTQRQSAAAAAVAYSNRAVMHWLDADMAAAGADLAKAQALAPQASFVVRNLAALQAHQNLASQTTATAQLASAAHK
jgi:hypothetical protein